MLADLNRVSTNQNTTRPTMTAATRTVRRDGFQSPTSRQASGDQVQGRATTRITSSASTSTGATRTRGSDPVSGATMNSATTSAPSTAAVTRVVCKLRDVSRLLTGLDAALQSAQTSQRWFRHGANPSLFNKVLLHHC